MTRPPTRRLVLTALGAVLLSACTRAAELPVPAEDEPVAAKPDALSAVASDARRDAATATALAAGDPALAPRLRVLAEERTLHAAACEQEVVRASGTVRGTPVAPAPTSAPAGSTSAVPAPDLAALQADLGAAATGAGALAADAPGYRAALLGCIAAACTVQLAVLG